MGAIRMRVQATDKTFKKSTQLQIFLGGGLQLKYKSSIYNITFSSEKSPHLNQDIEHHLQAKTVLIYVDFDVRGQLRGWTFSFEEALLWIIDSILWPEVMV